jgi:hypothetical protein
MNMTRKHLIRFTALAAILLAALADQRSASALEGCGYACNEMNASTCVANTLQGCWQITQSVCEEVLEEYGPDCVRACPNVLGYCQEDDDCAYNEVRAGCNFGE